MWLFPSVKVVMWILNFFFARLVNGMFFFNESLGLCFIKIVENIRKVECDMS